MPVSNDSHRADLASWVNSAQSPSTDFPIQNLPLGLFQSPEQSPRPGVAIGGEVLNLVAAAEQGFLNDDLAAAMLACRDDASLNPLIMHGRPALQALRTAVSTLLRTDSQSAQRARALRDALLVPMHDAEMLVPVRVGDYTDFYASIEHASNVGSMFRPDNALLPNYKWVPIGYHGRASSLVRSGTPVRRPHGQVKDDPASAPSFAPTRRLDYELEIGAFIGCGNPLGTSVPLGEAETHVAGLCLLNDWSARDVQAWEYQPLGPFLAKNFLTSISPWIVTLDALEPFRAPAYVRPAGDPEPLAYLMNEGNQRAGGFAIALEVLIASARMREQHCAPMRVSLGSLSSMYWTLAQLVTHHASNGCNLRPGDLIATGTVSGPTRESRGCLLERTWRGTEPLELPTGESRAFLEDGDEVIMRAWCERDGFRRIGFGECRGIVIPA